MGWLDADATEFDISSVRIESRIGNKIAWNHGYSVCARAPLAFSQTRSVTRPNVVTFLPDARPMCLHFDLEAEMHNQPTPIGSSPSPG